jgi:transposase
MRGSMRSRLTDCVSPAGVQICASPFKRYVKRQKNDASEAEAEAIAEAASAPTMRRVSVKSVAQKAQGIIF